MFSQALFLQRSPAASDMHQCPWFSAMLLTRVMLRCPLSAPSGRRPGDALCQIQIASVCEFTPAGPAPAQHSEKLQTAKVLTVSRFFLSEQQRRFGC